MSLILLVILVLVLFGGGGYYFYGRPGYAAPGWAPGGLIAVLVVIFLLWYITGHGGL